MVKMYIQIANQTKTLFLPIPSWIHQFISSGLIDWTQTFSINCHWHTNFTLSCQPNLDRVIKNLFYNLGV